MVSAGQETERCAANGKGAEANDTKKAVIMGMYGNFASFATCKGINVSTGGKGEHLGRILESCLLASVKSVVIVVAASL